MHVLADSVERDANTPPLLDVAEVCQRFGSIQALSGVSLAIPAGEIRGVCGHNGAGKSTLVKVLTGLVRPDAGSVCIDGRSLTLATRRDAQAVGIELVDQELSIIGQLTVRENLMLGDLDARFLELTRDQLHQSHLRAALDRVGLTDVALGVRADRLSLGRRQLLEIARAISRKARLLILDEPTATLSKGEIEAVFKAVREVAATGTAIIFISHRLDELLSLCDRVTVMRDGHVVGTHTVTELSREALIGLILGEEGSAQLAPQSRSQGSRSALTVHRVNVPGQVRDVDLAVSEGQVVGLAGQIGSGASELLRGLAGLNSSVSGRVEVHGVPVRVGVPRSSSSIAFISNDRKAEGLFLGRSVAENLTATRLGEIGWHGIVLNGPLHKAASDLGARLGIQERRVVAPVGALSGGNQQKAFIGRCLGRPDVEVLLLDEPTRGVDVGGRRDIHNLVRSFAVGSRCAVFASTELDELLDLSDVIVTMYAGRIVNSHTRGAFDPTQLLREMTSAQESASILPRWA